MSLQSTYSLQPDLGFPGQLDRSRPFSTLTMKNTEASAQIRMGSAVKRNGAPTTDLDALLPVLETDKVLGLVVREDTYSRTYTGADGVTFGQLGADGLVPNTLFTCATVGRMLVHVRTGATAGQGVWVRCTANSGTEYLGSIENADDGTEMIDCTTQAKFVTSCAADGVAWIEFDFTNI